ncbi:MAG: ATP-dependent DNA helicase RecG [Patescibacteria group bacterium]|jgi:ATP-dependent DNA helicase RecG
MNLDLTTPVSALGRVGKTTASRLKKLNLEIAADLIFYYPFRWQDFSQISEIAKLQPAEAITVKGKIQLIRNRRSPVKRRILTEGLITDQTGSVKVIWFNQPFLTKILKPGDEVYLSGKVDFDRYTLQLINPVYEKVKTEATIHTARLVPIYSLTSNLTQKQLRFLIKTVLPLSQKIPDWLPKNLVTKFKLIGLNQALAEIHFPSSHKLLNEAARRLKFDELFLFELQVILTRVEVNLSQAWPIKFFEKETKNFVADLAFTLTNDQKKAAWQILSDLQKNQPMNRLLEGEVGSGKTVVAAMAILNVALSGKQSVLMAPTEILARQHYQSLVKLLQNLKVKTALLTRSQRLIDNEAVSKNNILKQLKSGEIAIAIGTHALIQDEVEFKNLALAVVDEQHRFGVNQRKNLKQQSGQFNYIPHLLSMTATPIPRSLALALYGDLDLSIIKEMPKERKKIITKIVDACDRTKAYDFISDQIKIGRQVFVICPLIDPSDKLGVKAATEEYDKLKKEIFPNLNIALLHGKLKAEAKEKIMAGFLAKESDILVATSVVEVGVDVPNASVMLIEGADRFGLSQLHQFRGRVGRSIYQSYCLLFTDNQGQKTKARLQALVAAKDGFELAELDLKFRGPGEIYGTAQSGYPEFKIAQLTDSEIIKEAKEAAEIIIKESPDLKNYPILKNKMEGFIKTIHLE